MTLFLLFSNGNLRHYSFWGKIILLTYSHIFYSLKIKIHYGKIKKYHESTVSIY